MAGTCGEATDICMDSAGLPNVHAELMQWQPCCQLLSTDVDFLATSQ